MDEQQVIAETRLWISSVVIGLNLCPFARRVFEAGLIRYAVTDAADETALLDALAFELETLVSAPVSSIETILLIHPRALGDYLDYNDFLDSAERLIARRGLRGVVQIAGFHPAYRFAGTSPDAAENYTNRSPYPMMHLLREESISAVADDPDRLLEVPVRNIETMRAFGGEEARARLRAIRGGPNRETGKG